MKQFRQVRCMDQVLPLQRQGEMSYYYRETKQMRHYLALISWGINLRSLSILVLLIINHRLTRTSSLSLNKLVYNQMRGEQILALTGGFLSMIVYGSSYSYGTLIPYATSYIFYHGDSSITNNQMALIQTLTVIVLTLSMYMVNLPFLQRVSSRLTTVFCVICTCIVYLVLSLAKTYTMYVLIYGVAFGCFIGLGYMAPMKNCYSHIPNRKGLCSGVCIFGYGIAPFLFNFLLLELINPDDIDPIKLPDGRSIYSKEVIQHLPRALRIIAAIILFIGLCGAVLMRKKKKEQLTWEPRQSILSQGDINIQQAKGFNSSKGCFQTILFLKQKKIFFMTLTFLTTIPMGILIAFNYKEYGFLKIKDDKFLTLVGSLGAIFNGLGRLFMGVLFDKLSFKVISTLINLTLLVCAFLMPFIYDRYLYMAVVLLVYFVYGGCYSVYPTHTVRTIGSKLGSRYYFAVFAGNTMGSIIQLIARDNLVIGNVESGFKTCFYIFAACNVVSLMLTWTVKYEVALNKQELDE